MLKWTVTKRSDPSDPLGNRRPYHARRSLGTLQAAKNETSTPNRTRPRRSLASTAVNKELNRDKENRYTSTPCVATRAVSDESFTSTVAFRDVSNIATPSQPKKRAFTNTPVMTSTMKRKSNTQYSSTLPTFEVEYSPCEVKATPFAGLPGLADSYYENARYFRDDQPPPAKRQKLPSPSASITSSEKSMTSSLTPTTNRVPAGRFKFSFKKPKLEFRNEPPDDSLHSSQMGDVTLDKMIDAILESARKDKPKRSASVKSKDSKCSMESSPTYTAADDPASDLLKYEENIELSPDKYLQAVDRTIIIEEPGQNEREVKTPDSPKAKNRKSSAKRKRNSLEMCHLKRQRAVRRKLKQETEVGKPKNATPPQSNLPKSSPATPKYEIDHTYMRKTFDEIAQIETPQTHRTPNCLESDVLMSPTSQNEDKFLLSDYSNTMCPLLNDTTPDMRSLNWRASSTPTGEANTIRKCLTFSPATTSSENSFSKRSSVASTMSGRFSHSTFISGSIDLMMRADAGKLYIHGEWWMV